MSDNTHVTLILRKSDLQKAITLDNDLDIGPLNANNTYIMNNSH